jgi:mannose-1-phosphate guanylyltransferase
VYGVILAGGSRSRHQPLSGGRRPLAFQEDEQGRPLLARIAARLQPLIDPADLVVVVDRRLGQDVRSIVPAARILPEPVHRENAASIALATVAVERPDDEPMVVISADHDIGDPETFRNAIAAVAEGLRLAGSPGGASLCAAAVPPMDPRPGFSFLEASRDRVLRLRDLRVYPVERLEAHPDERRAQQLFSAGVAWWTAGVFVWRRDAIRAALERYTPLLTLLEPAHRSELALRAAYDRLQPLSIDEAVLVGAARDGLLLSLPLDVGWREIVPDDERVGAGRARADD